MTITDQLLPKRFRDKGYREAVVDANIGNTIASQIFALRKNRKWNQAQLAKRAGMAQARISVLEDPNYGNFSINTLKRIAAAFDVALSVRFVAFSELAAWIERISPETLAVPSFKQEDKRAHVKSAELVENPADVWPIAGIGCSLPKQNQEAALSEILSNIPKIPTEKNWLNVIAHQGQASFSQVAVQ